MISVNRARSKSSVDQAVLDAIVRFCSGSSVCHPSLYELSEAAGFSRRAICRAIKDLKNHGVLVLSHRFAGDGRQLSNEYFLAEGQKGGK